MIHSCSSRTSHLLRVGQNRIYIHRIFGDFPAKETAYILHIWFWPTLDILLACVHKTTVAQNHLNSSSSSKHAAIYHATYNGLLRPAASKMFLLATSITCELHPKAPCPALNPPQPAAAAAAVVSASAAAAAHTPAAVAAGAARAVGAAAPACRSGHAQEAVNALHVQSTALKQTHAHTHTHKP